MKTLVQRVVALFVPIVAATVLATSCVKNDVVLPNAYPEPVDNPYAVSEEEALQCLANELGMIDGEQTRAGGARTVKSIKSVKYRDMAPATRSAEAPEGIGDLLYIVEFEDGQGSAVLGADKRVEPVIAILDETVLTTEDFTEPTGDPDTDIKAYMVSLMSQSAASDAAEPCDLLPPMIPTTDIYLFEYDTIYYAKVNPLLRTKWNQFAPFNNMCPVINDTVCPAGCAPIAVAQIMMYHKYPANSINLYGQEIEWSRLSKFDINSTEIKTDADSAAMGRFVRLIGLSMGTTYTTTGSSAGADDAESTLSYHYGYADKRSFDFNLVKTMLSTRRPFYMEGFNSSTGAGHAWVLDGVLDMKVNTWKITYDTRFTPYLEKSRSLESTYYFQKVHCNFGWGGLCDGYYTPMTFNASHGLASDNMDTSAGDVYHNNQGDQNYNYDCNFETVVYEFR